MYYELGPNFKDERKMWKSSCHFVVGIASTGCVCFFLCFFCLTESTCFVLLILCFVESVDDSCGVIESAP